MHNRGCRGIFIALILTASLLVAAPSEAGGNPPVISTQPANQKITAGQSATFSVTATGSTPFKYQWKKNGTSITGATSASYTTPATVTADSGSQFVVIVTNSVGSATSNAATLTVNAPVAPSITTQPAGVTVTAGQTAKFSVLASGTSPLSYQWNKNGAAISGATSASYTTPATTVADSGAPFTVVVSNSGGTATSNAAILTVNPLMAPSIATQPASTSVTTGQTATFSVIATGSAPLAYQWKKNGKSISGATLANYTTPATTKSDNGSQFTVAVSNSGGTATSTAATLTVNPPVAPSIAVQPVNQTVTMGQAATFTVSAAGSTPLSYQWMKFGVAIPGATSAFYTTPATVASDYGSQFSVTVSNSVGSVISYAATLIVLVPGPLIPNLSSVNFASVSIPGSGNVPVQLSNAGSASVALSGVVISGPGFAETGLSTGQILLPGQAANMTVSFTPAATGTAAGSTTIISNATNSPTTISLTGIGVQVTSHSVEVSWIASTSPVVGYNIYQAGVSGGPYTLLNLSPVSTLQYLDLSVQAGQTYYYVVTATDSSNQESDHSVEASAAVPTP